jgi:hypothetical protein
MDEGIQDTAPLGAQARTGLMHSATAQSHRSSSAVDVTHEDGWVAAVACRGMMWVAAEAEEKTARAMVGSSGARDCRRGT